MPSNSDKNLLTVIILTKDEAVNLPYALESFRGLDARFFVVDSGSTDGTVEIARAHGCRTVHRDFTVHSEQLNWAIDNNPYDSHWVMRVDADERLTDELREELATRLTSLAGAVEGMIVRRRVYFWGRWIRHGGYYPTYLLRIWKPGTARSEVRAMDEHMEQDPSARTIVLAHDIIDENHKDLTFWIAKHNNYSNREMRDLLDIDQARSHRNAQQGQAKTRRWLKENVYSHAPLFLRAFLYWFYRYFIRLGFLDGVPGLVFHFLQGFWYRFLVDAKIYEHRLRRGDR